MLKEKELCGEEQRVFECYFGSCVIKRASQMIGVLKNEPDALAFRLGFGTLLSFGINPETKWLYYSTHHFPTWEVIRRLAERYTGFSR